MVKIIKKYNDYKMNNIFITCSPEHISKKIISYKKNTIYNENINSIDFKSIKICGIKNISNIEIKRKNENVIIITKGSNLKHILKNIKVDQKKTISNNLLDVYNTLGIEATRNILCHELENISNSKTNADILSKCMTITGKIIPINRKGISIMNKSFLSNISYENIMNIIKKQIPFGVKDDINNNTEKLIIGQKPNLGTGIFKLLRKKNLNIIYFDEKDKDKININNNIITLDKIKVMFSENCYKKISYNSYLLCDNYQVNKRLFTILEVIINKDIANENNIFYDKMLIIKNIKLNDIKFNIKQGNDLFLIKIYNKEKIEFYISKNIEINKKKYEINIIPTNILSSKIIVNKLKN